VLFYNAVTLKSAAVVYVFSVVYIYRPVCWNVRFLATYGFSAMCGCTGGMCMFRLFIVTITVSAARVWACGGRCVGVGAALVQCRACQGKQWTGFGTLGLQ